MTGLFNALWIVWILGFAGVETWAILEDKHHPQQPGQGFTLSAHLRRWFHTRTHWGRTVFLVVTGAFAAIFCVHIVSGGWF